MEDAVVAEDLSGHASVFAVFDGHGGDFCSRWSALQLPQRLRSMPKLEQPAETEADEVQAAATSLGDSLRQMDEDLRREGRKSWSCGTTAVALLVTPRCLTVANLGDSRAVLCRNGDPLPMSKDHKPRSPAERFRILQAGGCIIDGRVNGDLALSRALGDFRHKSVPGLPPAKQPVSADPEMRCVMRLRDDHFLLLACDGVWDVMSSTDAIDFVASFFVRASSPRPSVGNGAEGGINVEDSSPLDGGSQSGSPEGTRAAVKVAAEREALRDGAGLVCELLLDECLKRGSTDNISAVLVLLDPTLRPRRGIKRIPPAASAAAPCGLSPPVSSAPLASAADGGGTRARGLRRLLLVGCMTILCLGLVSSQRTLFRSEVLEITAPRKQVGLKFGDAAPPGTRPMPPHVTVARMPRNRTRVGQGRRHRGWKAKGGGGRHRRQRSHDDSE